VSWPSDFEMPISARWGPDPSPDPKETEGQSTEPSEVEPELPQVRGRRRGKRLVKKDDAATPASLTSEQRLLILDGCFSHPLLVT